MSMTARTSEYTLTERHLLAMSTPAACLTRIGRIDFHQRAPSFFRFGYKLTEECRPGGICNAFRKTMIMHHPVNDEVFDTDDTKSINDRTAFLMGEVVPPEANPFMHTSDHLAMLFPPRCAFGQLRVFLLHFGKSLLFLAEKARVGNFFTGGERGKRFESYINTYLGRRFGQTFGFTLYGEGCIPLPSTATVDGECFAFACHRTMQDDLDVPNTRKSQFALRVKLKARLRKGEAIITVSSTETREPSFLSSLAPPQESFESKVNTHGYILQYLGMNGGKTGAFLLQHGIRSLLPIARERLPLLFIGFFAFLQQVVIEPTAFIQCLVEQGFLFLCWIDSILKHLTHAHIMCLSRTFVKQSHCGHSSRG